MLPRCRRPKVPVPVASAVPLRGVAVGVRSCQDYACLFARLWSVVLYLLLWGSGCVVGRWGRVPGRTRLYCAGAADCSEDGLEPASASICERINSEFAFVKDRRRNRLAHCKANKLVGLFHNLRLLKRMQKASSAMLSLLAVGLMT